MLKSQKSMVALFIKWIFYLQSVYLWSFFRFDICGYTTCRCSLYTPLMYRVFTNYKEKFTCIFLDLTYVVIQHAGARCTHLSCTVHLQTVKRNWHMYYITLWTCHQIFVPVKKIPLEHNIGGVMVNVVTSSAVDRGLEPRLGQTKDYKIGICCFSAKHAALSIKRKYWLACGQDHVTEWGDMSTRGLLFQWASTIKIQLSVMV